jgi:hypothetical protein
MECNAELGKQREPTERTLLIRQLLLKLPTEEHDERQVRRAPFRFLPGLHRQREFLRGTVLHPFARNTMARAATRAIDPQG